MNARIFLVFAFALSASCGGGGGGGEPSLPTRFPYASVYSQSNGIFSGAIYAFGVHADGALSPVSGSPFAPTSGSASFAMAITHDPKFLYSVDSITGKLSAFLIHADGSLSAVTGSPFPNPFPMPDFPNVLVAHPTADFLYESGLAGSLLAWTAQARRKSRASPRTLTTRALSAVPASCESLGSAFLPGAVAVDPMGKFLYVGNALSLMGFGGPLYAYSIDAVGRTDGCARITVWRRRGSVLGRDRCVREVPDR
jgi:hypothetical protein